jgi:hypothetical protein
MPGHDQLWAKCLQFVCAVPLCVGLRTRWFCAALAFVCCAEALVQWSGLHWCAQPSCPQLTSITECTQQGTGQYQPRSTGPSEFSSPARKGRRRSLPDPAGKSLFISVSQLARRLISCLH